MLTTPEPLTAAQTDGEALDFIEAFARINIDVIRQGIGSPVVEAADAEHSVFHDWDNPVLLAESGVSPASVDHEARAGRRYLHIDVAVSVKGARATKLFLGFTGLSDKQQRLLFPVLSAQPPRDRTRLRTELPYLNDWLDWVRRDGFDPAAFITYQRGLGLHGKTQNLSGAIGATGAVIAFIDALRQLDPAAIIDHVGELPPLNVRSPRDVFEWRAENPEANNVKALLLRNGRALVFASSKDANIFMPLGDRFADCKDALKRFNKVSKKQDARSQVLHEFAVGEVKTATDLANLHERMGLASRETQTELRTDRFLMMAVLNREILQGGEQGRVMNNRDITRFSHTFNLHHCWGWDGGRDRHPEHWQYFVSNVGRWCGLHAAR